MKSLRKKWKKLCAALLLILTMSVLCDAQSYAESEEMQEIPTVTLAFEDPEKGGIFEGISVYADYVDFCITVGTEEANGEIAQIELRLYDEAEELLAVYTENSKIWKMKEEKVLTENDLKKESAFFARLEGLSDGHYTLTAVVWDKNGAMSEETALHFLMDSTAPSYEITYSEPAENAYTKDADKIYYREAIIADLTILEKTSFDEEKLTITVKSIPKGGGEAVEVLCWEQGRAVAANQNYRLQHEDGTKKFRLTILAVSENDNDGYIYEVRGTDCAGNRLKPADAAARECLEKIRVMDTTAPVLEHIAYDTETAFYTFGTRDYVNAPTNLTFRLREHNPSPDCTFTAGNTKEQFCRWKEQAEELYETTFHVPMYGEKGDEQTVSFMIVDKAGNAAVFVDTGVLRSEVNTSFSEGLFMDRFTIDTVAPVISFAYEKTVPVRENVEGIDYFQEMITITVSVDEHNFDAGLFEQMVQTLNPEAEYEETAWQTEGDIHRKTFVYRQEQQYTLRIHGKDIAQNALILKKNNGVSAVQPEEKRAVYLKTALDRTAPVIGDENGTAVRVLTTANGTTTDGQKLYRGDITYQIELYDPMIVSYASGIDHLRFWAVGEDGTFAEAVVDKTGHITGDLALGIQTVRGDFSGLARGKEQAYSFQVTIRAENFCTNGIILSIEAEDVSGNMKIISAEPAAIDTTAPIITIDYDQNDVKNEKYFSEQRTAYIYVMERNFREECLHFLVNGREQPLSFSLQSAGSKNRDDAVWKGSYTFAADDDYQIECYATDLAGNEGTVTYEGEAPQEFVIDQTLPKITVEYDNYDVLNERYYKEPRTATITIEEHNFSAEDVNLLLTAQSDGTAMELPQSSAWSGEGDFHRAKIFYDYDAEFTFDIECMDLAQNQAEDDVRDRFVVDLTPPEIEIYGVEDHSANRGEVRPGVRIRDVNYDIDGTKVTLSGYENGLMQILGSRSMIPNGAELQLNDFAREACFDDLYTMHAEVSDLAGNVSETSVLFSVNRFGSVYTFDKKTEALVGNNGTYYTKEAPDIIVTETNVDTLEFQEITLNRNGKLKTLEEGTEYTVTRSGDDTTWKHNTYQVGKKNFEEDGRYTMTIYSIDRAENSSDNHQKGKNVEFVVDKTSPSVLVTGVKDRGQYRETMKELTLDIEDNIALEHAEVKINDKTVVYTGAQLLENDGRLTLQLEGADQWQTLQIKACDAAGNCYVSETIHCLITPNLWIQFYEKKPVFWGTMTGMLCFFGVFAYQMSKKRRLFIKS